MSSLSFNLIVSESSFLIISIYCGSIFSAQQQMWQISVSETHPNIQQGPQTEYCKSWTNWKLFPDPCRFERTPLQFIVSGMLVTMMAIVALQTGRRLRYTHTTYESKTEKVFVDSALYRIDTNAINVFARQILVGKKNVRYNFVMYRTTK